MEETCVMTTMEVVVVTEVAEDQTTHKTMMDAKAAIQVDALDQATM